MPRYRIVVAAFVLFSMSSMLRAQEEMLPILPPQGPYPENWSEEAEAMPVDESPAELHEVPMSGAEQYPYEMPTDDPMMEDTDEWPSLWPKPRWFGLRHSSTHGRHAGRGQPFTGTSWRNRPFYIGGEIGPMWFTQSLDDNVSTDIDTFGGFFLGWDTDHYWGNELHFDWSTPEFKNSEAPDTDRTDSLFTWNYSLFYYPWGDSKIRPYWRAGIGHTHFDYPLDDGSRHDEWMWTFPLGLGVKYPIRRWLAARAEMADFISLDSDHPTQHNVALTFGLEWRFGAHPPSYWPWNPGRHIW